MAIAMLASVIIPTFNNLDFLKRTISNLEKQKLDLTKFEVIVVNDGSTDGTHDWLSTYSGELQLIYLQLPQNQGRSVARNKGIEASSSEVIILLDADMDLVEDFVSLHVKRHDGTQKAVIGRVLYYENKNEKAWVNYLQSRGCEHLKVNERIPGRYFLSGNSSFPKSVWESVNGFNEDLRVYGEDLEFGLRLEKFGVKFEFAPELKCWHLHVRGLESSLELYRKYGSESLPILIKRHPELYFQMKLDFMEKGSVSRLLKSLVFSDIVESLLKRIALGLNKFFVPSQLFNYLIYNSYYKGYKYHNGNNN